MSVSPPETAQNSSKRYYCSGLSHFSFTDLSLLLMIMPENVNNMFSGDLRLVHAINVFNFDVYDM